MKALKAVHFEVKLFLKSEHLFSNVYSTALKSEIDVGQGIHIGPAKFAKKNKHRAMNKPRAS